MKKIKKFFNAPKPLLYCLAFSVFLVVITFTVVLRTLGLFAYLECAVGSIGLVIVALLNIWEWHKEFDSKH